jgi:hypothetical protein
MSISNYLIPLVSTPQMFTINLAGISYNMTCKWNNAQDSDGNYAGWALDISDSNNNPLACNIPLITGADCLSGLEYLGIQGSLIAFTSGDPTAVPTFTNLGSDSNLYFQTSVGNNGG